MTGPISRNRLIGSLEEAASWPGAARNTVVTLATALVAARADEEGSSYFQDLSERDPADATAQALAGFFQVRAGEDVAGAITKLDKAATTDLGLPQYFRGLALAELLPDGGRAEAELAAGDTGRADQVIADLEFVLAARDQFPVGFLRSAYQGLARASRCWDGSSRRPRHCGGQVSARPRRTGENMPLPLILDVGYLPASLRDHPAAVVPYLVIRDCFIARLYHLRTGYWQPDGQGLDPRSPEETAAALDLLAGGTAEAFVKAAATLADQGDLTLAPEILAPGLLRYPDSSELPDLRQAVLVRLMDERQLSDPFGFLFYAEQAGAELAPVG